MISSLNDCTLYLTLNSRAPCRTLIGQGGDVEPPPTLLSQFLLELEG